MSTEIKNTLFRFVTMRAPELSDEKNITNRFLYREKDKPSGAARVFDQAILNKTTLEEKWIALKERAVTFSTNALETEEDCKNINEALYEFAIWLARNKTTYNESDLRTKITGLNANSLSIIQIEELWDNLIYQVITNESFYVKEAIIQLLIVDNLIKKVTLTSNIDSKTISEVVNSKVVLPKGFFEEGKPQPISQRASTRTAARMASPTTTAQTIVVDELSQNENNIATAQSSITSQNKLKEELAKIEKEYKVAYETAYKAYEAKYESLIKPILDKHEKEVDASNRAWYAKRDPKIPIDPNNPYDKPPYIPQPELPKFEFEFKKEIDLNSLKTQLSTESFQTLLGVLGIPAPKTTTSTAKNKAAAPASLPVVTTSFADVTDSINKNIAQNEQTILVNTPSQGQEFVAVNGVVIPIIDSKTVKQTAARMAAATTSTESVFIPSGYGVRQLGIADYKKVIQTTHGYVEGDVAHIENVMASEYKERATRKLRRSENTTTVSSETEKEKLSDTSSTSRFEMQSEIASILQESKDFNAGLHMGYSNDNVLSGKFTLDTNVNTATHSSKEESNRQAITQARDITERAMERIVTKVKQERIEKIIEEYEETNRHGFDNTGDNKEHITGVFRWIDKIYKNQVVNYGKRLMFEFMIPEPSKLHTLGMTENQSYKDETIKRPEDPRKAKNYPLTNHSFVTEPAAEYWATQYNVKYEILPPENIYLNKSMSFVQAGDQEKSSSTETIQLTEGYEAVNTNLIIYCKEDTNRSDKHSFGVTVGNAAKFYSGGQISYPNGRSYDIWVNENLPLSNIQKELSISYKSLNYLTGSIAVTVKLQRSAALVYQWREETFRAIMEGYEKALQKFNEIIAEQDAKGITIRGTNPGFYRQIENTVLRKNCISYIIDQTPNVTRTYGNNMSNDTNANAPKTFTDYEIITKNESLNEYTSFAKFIEQAFEWDIMSYNFYPYYWGNREDWSALYAQENNDPLFRSFLQSGMARVIVTVRPGFEEAVHFYMQTGVIWNGGEVPVIDDKLFLSIVDELREPVGKLEGDPWHTRVPTALTILQAGNAGLKVDKALPYDYDGLKDFPDESVIPQPAGFTLNGVNTSANTKISSNSISFVYQYIDDNNYKTISSMNSLFPRKFECQGEEIIIEKETGWKANDSSAIVYQRLAEKITLLTGIEAKQVTAANGNPNGIQFIIDTNVVTEFSFVKFPVSGEADTNNVVYADLTAEFLRLDAPSQNLNRFVDAKGVALTDAEGNTLLPIARFKV
jgi:hypothetical protein